MVSVPGCVRVFVSVGVVVGPLALAGCSKPGGTSSDAGAMGAATSATPTASGAPAANPRAAKSANATNGPSVLGERLTTRIINDPAQQGLAVGVVAVPEKWRYQPTIVWNYANYSNPVTLSAVAENPDSAEAVFAFPAAQFFELRPDYGMLRPGQNSGGLIFARRVPPLMALGQFVQRTRGAMSNLTFVGSKDLPDLPAALKLPPSPNQQGLGMKVTYTLNGQPVEEEFYAVYYAVDIPYDGPQGRTWQTNWGLQVHSFRAPSGTLDTRRPVFAAIAKSFRPNPEWQARLAAINAYLAQEFNRQLQAGYDAIAAAGRLSQQISANNDAMIAGIERQRQAAAASGSRAATTSSGRTASDEFDDYIRGVHTVDDPYYGTSQHAATEQFHWTDGYGNYRHSNDTTYDPNRSETGNWQPMPMTR